MSVIEERIDAAIERITNGQGCMRIPAEESDPDLVLVDCKSEIARLRAEADALRDLLPEVSVCVQYAIDYGSPSRQSDRRELLGKIDAAMGANA